MLTIYQVLQLQRWIRHDLCPWRIYNLVRVCTVSYYILRISHYNLANALSGLGGGGYKKIRTERGSTQIYLPEGISKVFIKEDWLKNEEQLAVWNWRRVSFPGKKKSIFKRKVKVTCSEKHVKQVIRKHARYWIFSGGMFCGWKVPQKAWSYKLGFSQEGKVINPAKWIWQKPLKKLPCFSLRCSGDPLIRHEVLPTSRKHCQCSEQWAWSPGSKGKAKVKQDFISDVSVWEVVPAQK